MVNKNIKIGISILIFLMMAIITMAIVDVAGIVKTNRLPGYNAMFGNFVAGSSDRNIKADTVGEIINVSFYLPVDSFVFVSSSGGLAFNCGESACQNAVAHLWITIDDQGRADWDDNKYPDSEGSGWAGYSISKMYKLKKGYHTASLYGNSDNEFWSNANIVAIATQKGSFSSFP